MDRKPRILITLRQGGQNGGPYVSHQRIMESELKGRYEFIPLMVPEPRVLARREGMQRFVESIRSATPDVVHYAGLQLEGYFVSRAIKLAGVKRSVLAVHGSSREAVYFPMHKRFVVSVLEATTLKRATVCYGVSDYVVAWDAIRRHARHCYGRIHNLPHPEIAPHEPNLVRQELGLSADDTVLVSTGRVTREKGFDVLLEALSLIEPLSRHKVLIVGDGEYLEEMKSGVKASGLSNDVLFLGYRADVPQILAASDIFVLCSLHETLSNSIIEAGQESLPVVSTNVGGIPEIVCDGHNGLLVSPGDAGETARALQSLIDDADLRRTMGQNAYERIKATFVTGEILGQLDAMYQELLNGAWDEPRARRILQPRNPEAFGL